MSEASVVSCPACRSTWTVPILYGPGSYYTDDRLDTGGAIHAGCRTVSGRAPGHYCRSCRARWGGDAPIDCDAWRYGPHRGRLDIAKEAMENREHLLEVRGVAFIEGSGLDLTPNPMSIPDEVFFRLEDGFMACRTAAEYKEFQNHPLFAMINEKGTQADKYRAGQVASDAFRALQYVTVGSDHPEKSRSLDGGVIGGVRSALPVDRTPGDEAWSEGGGADA